MFLQHVSVVEEQLRAARDDIAEQTEVIRFMKDDDVRSKKHLLDLAMRLRDRESEVHVLQSRVADAEDEMKRAHAVIKNQESKPEYVADLEVQLQAAKDLMAWQIEEIRKMNATDERRKISCKIF
jgi:predicted  nucleic acid-binding Zn-ribbon protein